MNAEELKSLVGFTITDGPFGSLVIKGGVTLSSQLVIDRNTSGDVDAIEMAKNHIREMIARRVYDAPRREIYEALDEFFLTHVSVDFEKGQAARDRLMKALEHPAI